MPDDAVRAEQRALVRRGYDAVSHVYRGDAGESNDVTSETTATYAGWLRELTTGLAPGAHIVDLGCGAGVPADRLLVDAGFAVTGIDIAAVQIDRARSLVPGATFVCADLAGVEFAAGTFDAAVALYALIHVPLADQRALLPRVRRWLRPPRVVPGYRGTHPVDRRRGLPRRTDVLDHADEATYLAWLAADGFDVVWHRYVPEGSSGHTLVLASAAA